MSEELTVSFEADPRHLPRGGLDMQALAVTMLLGREAEADDPDAREAEANIEDLATTLNSNLDASAAGIRLAHIVTELHAVEAAAGALAATLANLSPATLDVLDGRGIGSAPLSLQTAVETVRSDALGKIAGRYTLPVEPDATLPVLGLAMATRRPPQTDWPISWPVGAAALRELARVRRREFEEEFRADLASRAEAREFGPSGTLPPSQRQRRSKPRRRANDPAKEPDLGGRQNAVDLMRGAPGWVLARDSFQALRYWRPELKPTMTRDGPLHRFVRAVHAYATDGDIEGPDAGLEHHVRKAVKIMAELERIAPDGVAKPEDFDRWASLCIARDSGEVPAWLP